MTAPADATARDDRDDEPTSIGEVVDLVKAYAKQETSARSRAPDAGWRSARPAPSCSASGCRSSLLGLLRLVQTEWATVGRGLAGRGSPT